MKLMTITTDYYPSPGGVARYAKTVADFFGSEMEVCVPEFPKIPCGWLLAVKQVLTKRPDIVFVHQILPMGTVALICKIVRRTEYIVFFHGMDFELATRNYWKRFLSKRIIRNAKAVVANSQYLANEVSAFSGRESMVVYPIPAIRYAREEKQPHSKINILSVARLVERKGFKNVLHSIARNKKWWQDIKYTIVGVGDYADEIRKIIAELGIQEIVELQETADDDKIRAAYLNGDIFVLPTVTKPGDREGFGIVYLEAATFGMPSIASRIPGVDEAVKDGVTGLLVTGEDELDNAMEELIYTKSLRKKLGDCAKTNVEEKFQPEKTLAPLLELVKVSSDIPEISIVIPTYNHASVITSTIRSVWNSVGVKTQIIVINDGSTDNTEEVLDSLKAEGEIIVVNQENTGAAAARNRGLGLASSEFVMFLDADIVLSENALKTLSETLRLHPEASFAYADFLFGRKKFRVPVFTKVDFQDKNSIHTSALIRRKDAILFDPTLRRMQDWDYWMRMSEAGFRGVKAPGTLFNVRISRRGYSAWLPSAFYNVPWKYLPFISSRAKAYEDAKAHMLNKHKI